jgi:HAD superfamily hydrolase (TIGR01509 family)
MQNVELTLQDYLPLAGNPSAYIAQKLSERSSLGSPEAIMQTKRAAYALLQKKSLPIERTINFIRELSKRKKELGIQLGVASAARKDEIVMNLKHIGIAEVFDLVISGQDDLISYRDPEGINKPKPYIYLHTAKLLGLSPSQCVACEDSAAGVQAAKDAGCITFAVPNKFTKQHDFSRADFVIQPAEKIHVDEFFERLKT